jgi:hypothetical protein
MVPGFPFVKTASPELGNVAPRMVADAELVLPRGPAGHIRYGTAIATTVVVVDRRIG